MVLKSMDFKSEIKYICIWKKETFKKLATEPHLQYNVGFVVKMDQ